MKILIIALAFTAQAAFGNDEIDENKPLLKLIPHANTPDFRADRTDLVFCSSSCQVLLLKNGKRYYCKKAGGEWIPIGDRKIYCEMGR